jgi:hypothetical protein
MTTAFHEVNAIKAFISHIKDEHIKWHLEDAFQNWEDASYAPDAPNGVLTVWKNQQIMWANHLYGHKFIDLEQLSLYKEIVMRQTVIPND